MNTFNYARVAKIIPVARWEAMIKMVEEFTPTPIPIYKDIIMLIKVLAIAACFWGLAQAFMFEEKMAKQKGEKDAVLGNQTDLDQVIVIEPIKPVTISQVELDG